MVNSNANAIGIIFPNSYDNLVPELAGDRLMASIPFAGRYRIIDFLLSSLANCGISNIAIVVRENYHSLMDIWAPDERGIFSEKTEVSVFFRPMRRKI
mgnify:CR=1 FL=1